MLSFKKIPFCHLHFFFMKDFNFLHFVCRPPLPRVKLMSPTKMPCPPPVTCWICCCRKTPAQAPAQLRLDQGPQARGPLVQAPAPTAAAPLALAAPVSTLNFTIPEILNDIATSF